MTVKYNKPFELFTKTDMLQRMIQEDRMFILRKKQYLSYLEKRLNNSVGEDEKDALLGSIADATRELKQVREMLSIAIQMKKEVKENG